jgi:cation transport protein ChaC
MKPKAWRRMALTADLVARAARVVEDVGPSPGAVYMTDEDYDLAIRAMLADAPAGDVWLFGYGSLLWKPVCEVAESRRAAVRGWHRVFCIRLARFRGTRERPGLMMSLDRGGQCGGVILRLPADQVQASLGRLYRREIVVKPGSNVPRWLTADTDDGPIRAIGFVVDRRSPHYAGKLALEAVADILATAAGHWGAGAEYLRETVVHLEERGIRDRNLWRLQALVAERLAVQDDRHSRSRLEEEIQQEVRN